MGGKTEEVKQLMRPTLILQLLLCCLHFTSNGLALHPYHFSPYLSPDVLLWIKTASWDPASAMSCILLSPSISVDTFTSLYTPTVTRPCTGETLNQDSPFKQTNELWITPLHKLPAPNVSETERLGGWRSKTKKERKERKEEDRKCKGKWKKKTHSGDRITKADREQEGSRKVWDRKQQRGNT